MNNIQKKHYQEMLERDRLFPFIDGDRLVCFITYYIIDKQDINKYTANPWKTLDDNDKEDTCYISQLITDKNSKNPYMSYNIWSRFIEYIKSKHPTVTTISWRRWKGDKVHVYNKDIR